MFLEIITPDKQVFAGEVVSATFPGTDGSFQVLNNHAPIISTLEKGNVIAKSASEEHSWIVDGGVVEVLNNKVIVLADGIL